MIEKTVVLPVIGYELQKSRLLEREQRTSQGSTGLAGIRLHQHFLEASRHRTPVDLECFPGLPLVYDLDTETNT